MQKYPNIFTSQSKEFSQDAFIDWLLRCADPTETTDPSLREVGIAFLRMLVAKHNDLITELGGANIPVGLEPISLPDPVTSVSVRRQFFRIDVLGQVNGEHGLNIVFENKLGTGIHDDQLRRYRKVLHEHYNINKGAILGVYYKVMEEMDYERVRHTHQYCTISREEMLKFLEQHPTDNPIMIMYRQYLGGIHGEITRWKQTPAAILSQGDKWHDGMWNGFLSSLYQELKTRLKGQSLVGLGWGWVNNVSGGFHGMWLGNWENDLPTVYLQCDEHILKVRMSGPRSNAAMHETRQQLINELELKGSEPKAGRMQHNAQSAEILNLGPYIKPDASGMPSILLTADHLLHVFTALKEATTTARKRPDIPSK